MGETLCTRGRILSGTVLLYCTLWNIAALISCVFWKCFLIMTPPLFSYYHNHNLLILWLLSLVTLWRRWWWCWKRICESRRYQWGSLINGKGYLHLKSSTVVCEKEKKKKRITRDLNHSLSLQRCLFFATTMTAEIKRQNDDEIKAIVSFLA